MGFYSGLDLLLTLLRRLCQCHVLELTLCAIPPCLQVAHLTKRTAALHAIVLDTIAAALARVAHTLFVRAFGLEWPCVVVTPTTTALQTREHARHLCAVGCDKRALRVLALHVDEKIRVHPLPTAGRSTVRPVFRDANKAVPRVPREPRRHAN